MKIIKFVLFAVVAFAMNKSCSGQHSELSIEDKNIIQIIPFSRPNTCKSPKKELHRDLIDNLNNNFLKIYTRLIQVQTKCRFGEEFVPALEQYRAPLNAVIDTLKSDGEIKETLRKYDNALLKLNRDFRKFSEKKARSLFCFNILSDFRRAAASTAESLVIAVLIIRDTKCASAHQKLPH